MYNHMYMGRLSCRDRLMNNDFMECVRFLVGDGRATDCNVFKLSSAYMLISCTIYTVPLIINYVFA